MDAGFPRISGQHRVSFVGSQKEILNTLCTIRGDESPASPDMRTKAFTRISFGLLFMFVKSAGNLQETYGSRRSCDILAEQWSACGSVHGVWAEKSVTKILIARPQLAGG